MTERKEMLVEDVLNYLTLNHLGKGKGKTRSEIAYELGIDKRELRRITSEINRNAQYNRLISTTNLTYVCNTKEECVATVRNTYRTAITLIKKARAMEKKMGLQGQVRLPVDNELKESIVEVYGLQDTNCDREEE